MDGLSNIQIQSILGYIPGFSGVYSSDTLPKRRIFPLESGVVNLEPHTKRGSHWVCFYNDPSKPYVEYFDSYGCPADDFLERFLRTSNKPILAQSNQLQADGSEECGWYCIFYVKQRANGKDPLNIISEFTDEPSRHNESLVIRPSRSNAKNFS